METRKIMAVALCATAFVATTTCAEDDLIIESAKPVKIANPVNPKPGVVFRGYNLPVEKGDQFLAIKTTLASAATVKSTVIAAEQFTFEPFLGEVKIAQGVWEGFLNCKCAAQCSLLIKQKGDYAYGGFILYLNGKKVIGKSGTGQQSANIQLKAGYNHIELISQYRYPVQIFISPVGSTKPPRQLSPAMMCHDEKPVVDPF